MKSTVLPLALKLDNRVVWVVGEGDAADYRAELCAHRDARVVRVDEPSSRLERPFIVFVATDHDALESWAIDQARAAGALLNVMDTPEFCDFSMPAFVLRGDISVAISSGGVSPVMARLVRGKIEAALPSYLGQLTALAGRWQSRVREALPDTPTRRRFWERLLSQSFLPEALSDEALDSRLAEALAGAGESSEAYFLQLQSPRPDDLTLAALRLMQQADYLVFDPTVGAGIKTVARRDAVVKAEFDGSAGAWAFVGFNPDASQAIRFALPSDWPVQWVLSGPEPTGSALQDSGL